MPELPEVESVRRTMSPGLLGRTPKSLRVGLAKLVRPTPKALSAGIRGREIERLERHGKLLMLKMAGSGVWAIHLGMTGQVILAETKPKVKHVHITVGFDDDGPNLYFRDPRQFGFMAWCPDRASLEAGPLANMGPDALGMDQALFLERLSGRGGKLKSLLLDQRVLAGVGNIYADESLHRAGLNPLSRPCDLSQEQLCNLHDHLQETLNEALARGGSSVSNFVDAHGRPGTFQHAHRVYKRGGQPCPACGAPIERIVVAGRSTHFCPHCQK
ncbi:MAG: bifunctional DNA-formamidopyrimidine glycosylase/DNA-(apurinic or apyrimidinic site) lyase [Desulfarculaceae bacterium]|nr:bifunctional DNA-formamidopyrimidine glycosylase/DNA-(apurinic or apyrimidinic site) lyase [Desulfarculaceae bacterium]MCF8072020.1 bifunctional DNA-formamidopyrimidine glycosylase/DNA-(apurinic or apyrimidinic site) lyase [Desulfarculaceae bacterium]MCF8101537.1 bifunctional DNA-formamidopyrimidine glycosylase/DNA-(apurinic or apyrimidinic site) lyase [Desulfarculaceae bacterium]MCF8115087.1 bifunctional DNA-formamidopyrimidine glycosylase/DNA-(apurinic or apyrimidinic site) lyase [Desulfarc